MGTTVTQSNPLYNKLEIVKVGTTTITTGIGVYNASSIVPHNLGYVPFVISAVEYSSNSHSPIPYFTLSAGVGAPDIVQAVLVGSVTDTQVEFVYQSDGGVPIASVTIKYWLLREATN